MSVLPTDTVYGLASLPSAIPTLYGLKGRPDSLPIAVLVEPLEQGRVLVDVAPAVERLAQAFCRVRKESNPSLTCGLAAMVRIVDSNRSDANR